MTTAARGRMPTLGTPLTERQVQIIAGFARGESNIEIAGRLFLSPLTVKEHGQRIAAATGHGTRAAMVDHGYRVGALHGLAAEFRTPANLRRVEQQVLEGMARGLTNADIGGELGMPEGTVGTHATRLFRRLRARDRAHAVALGWQQGLLGPDAGALAVVDGDERAGCGVVAPLTRRQQEVLLLVANGKSATLIAHGLSISTDSVNTILAAAYRNLGVHDRAHAVAVALRVGEFSLEDVLLPAAPLLSPESPPKQAQEAP